MAEIKHVGRLKSTNKKVIVAYRSLPGDAHYCLILPTENLSDSYHDAVINLVESSAGQDAYEFAEAMARTNFPDGSIMLAALHTQGKLIKVPTDSVEMLPAPSVSILLSELNQIIAEQRGVPVDDLSLKSNIPQVKETEVKKVEEVKSDVTKTSSASVNETAPAGSPEDQAKFYRSQADKLAKDAAAMRRKAEELAPTKKVK